MNKISFTTVFMSFQMYLMQFLPSTHVQNSGYKASIASPTQYVTLVVCCGGKALRLGKLEPFGNQYTLLKDQLFLQPTAVRSRCFYCSTTAYAGLSIVQEVEVQVDTHQKNCAFYLTTLSAAQIMQGWGQMNAYWALPNDNDWAKWNYSKKKEKYAPGQGGLN